MPTYEYRCKNCNKKFILKLSLEEKKKAKCPKCKSRKLSQLISGFTAQTSKKS